MDTVIESLKQRREGVLFVISGPSGAGKGTIVQSLLPRHQDLHLSVSMTTRQPRPGEIEGQHYFFVSQDEFETRISQGEFLEYARYNGQYYGTPRSFALNKIAQGQDVILEIEVQGAQQVRKNWNKRSVLLFVIPPTWSNLESRLRQRSTESESAIQARLNRANEEMGYLPDYDYYVINDQLEEAVIAVSSIIDAERQRIITTSTGE
ncbi:guanylate kinase [bacterium (Candidatus Blackallbacteria) CG17_big_fil_post_rev_8_21_14_2_50_48_46]|uniref:Guanylate kinase n=1 Tax=bacterium (Candidatus Blackallbacteria) CG17_big_fil_post_rev_8_21_14_2_50_48_46 TaxID=2014261 RepID=A0A2M7G6F0_9BACT|nr:MAG: guanylate kinase [bacterium (Candidatus Blackallbacteria) CG18_big_fil_WC_8_21_14_2_50_49_26]PIW17610.1 MAG: guanylate kinase [bacterium (Candidatus Blackallbacteria) CG17_big_fil_post_rev_8_21_14_2_50_48_46]PIW48465.1 MAG: guanylate kinase [bacterium (Candidatus Blackallbacteria) CG13_big_fil_rev_8_21_14_2_50_49_14]